MKKLFLLLPALLMSAPALAATAPVINIPSITCIENAPCTLTLTKTKASSYSKINIQSVDGTAKAGVDFQAVNKTLTLANSTTSAKVDIPLIDNQTYQGTRTLTLKVTVLRFAQIANSDLQPISVTITDDETQPSPCPAGTVLTTVGTDQHCLPPPTPTPTPTPVPTPTPAPTGLAGELPIADNFDTATAIEPGPGMPIDNGGDPLGAFRFFCHAGQLLKDDPIAIPGQSGASHLHQFIGNTAANANSTYASLRTSGGSTCDNLGQPNALNRSSYWMPAMLDGIGNAVRPDAVLVYYKQLPNSSPYCGLPDAGHTGYCTALPNGIRFIFGYNMKTMTGGPTDTNSWDQWALTYQCTDHSRNIQAPATGTYHTISEVVRAGCPVNAWLKVGLDAPPCWDGKNLDTADHRSHVVYADGVYVAGAGQRACPIDHPYRLPGIAYAWFFNTTASFAAGNWRLSSDDMMAAMGMTVEPGKTLHMDYFEAWSPTAKGIWIANCINRHLTCSNMELGNGTEGKNAGVPPGDWQVQPLVPLNAVPYYALRRK